MSNIIPGPNNEMVTQSVATPPQYKISASFAETASFALNAGVGGPVDYVVTASGALTNQTASYAISTTSASFSVSASYIQFLVDQTNLGSGTVLSLNTNYYVTIGGNRTLTFTGTSSSGDWIDLKLNVTGGMTLGFPTSSQLGNGFVHSLAMTSGSHHELTWQYVDSKWWLADSVSSGTSSYATTASYAMNGGGSSVSASWASSSLSASYAESALSASYTLVTFVTESIVSSSWASASFSSSYAETASYAMNGGGSSVSASWASSSLSASYALTASYALNGGGGTPTTASSGFFTGSIGAYFDGGGSIIPVSSSVDVFIPYPCSITSWTMLTDVTGSAQVDVWKKNFSAGYPPTDADSITVGQEPSMSAELNSASYASLTNWSSSLIAGDILKFFVDSCASASKLSLQLVTSRTGTLSVPTASYSLTSAYQTSFGPPGELANNSYIGLTEPGTASLNLTFGDVCHFSASGVWDVASAATASVVSGSADKKLGICVLTAGATSQSIFLLHGKVRADTPFPTFVAGSPVYLSEVSGALSISTPTNSRSTIRVAGYGNTGDELYFNPSNETVEIS